MSSYPSTEHVTLDKLAGISQQELEEKKNIENKEGAKS
jgi:hypothetical protein